MTITKIKKARTDKNSEAWIKLCDYIDRLAIDGGDEFFPAKELGGDLFKLIETLPPSIKKLKHVRKVILYGSNLVMIPPEIGQMNSLEEFVPYTSYHLCWFPYEITYCTNLKSSTVSTRALYHNPKNRKPFPNLINFPVRYDGDSVTCSVCQQETNYEFINQYWITLRVGTDILPLLVNLCSYQCGMELPDPIDNDRYPRYPHRGGKELKPMSEDDWK